MEERRFVCKYCCKRFRCGKALGGHIRTHMIQERNHNHYHNNVADQSDSAAAAVNGEIRNNRNKRDLLWSETGNETAAAGSNIYGLRENPKKTMRFAYPDRHAIAAAALERERDEKFCKECGKGFPSLKALCGHMASHSEKHKFEEEKLVLVDSDQSDSEAFSASTNQRRSKRMRRFKSLSLAANHYPSSSVSEVEQEEQEEVARCLMLLSRDCTSHKGRFASESSDNNSIILEPKSSSPYGNSSEEKRPLIKDIIKFKSFDDLDSRYFSYGSKTKMAEDKSEFEDYDCELSRGRSKYTTTPYKKLVLEDFDYDTTTYETTKKTTATDFAHDEEMYELSGGETDSDPYSTNESDETSSETDSFPAPRSQNGKKSNNKAKNKLKLNTKKSKEHECPICYRVFKSGQALGGHKRSHFIGGSEENNTLVIKQGAVPCLIDLNLPAPDE